MSDSGQTFRFRDFELDVAAYELRRRGRPVRLERRGMDLLILLIERRRQLVTRLDIVDRLWGKDVFVDVETGVNTVISKVREVLRDSSSAAAFVETVPVKGYRFIADVEVVCAESPQPPAIVTIAVLPFANLAANADFEYLADGFTEEATTAVGQIDPDHLRVIGRTSVMAYKHTTKSLAEIGRELGATHLIEGSMRAEYGDRGTNPTPSVSRASERARQTANREHGRVRFLSEGSLLLESAHAGDQQARNRILRTRDCARPEVRARLVGYCRRVHGEPDEQRCAPAAHSAARSRGCEKGSGCGA